MLPCEFVCCDVSLEPDAESKATQLMEAQLSEAAAARVPGKLRLTAVIANYNYGRYLPIAVAAIVNQSRPADELILIDDASTDGSQRVVDQLAERYPFIKVVKNKVNRGAIPTGKDALELATGDCFYWGSADDMVLPGFFESAMSLLERFPAAPLCVGVPVIWREHLDEQYQTCVGMPSKPGFLPAPELWRLVRQGVWEASGAWTIYRIADTKAIGGFRPSLRWHADWFPTYVLALGHGACWTAQPAAVMRIQASSYSSTGVNRAREHREVMAEMVQLIALEMPTDTQTGFRASGIFGRLTWPIPWLLLAKRRYWSYLTGPFWRIWLGRLRYQVVAAIARALIPDKMRRAVGRRVRSQTKFDLSAMKSRAEL